MIQTKEITINGKVYTENISYHSMQMGDFTMHYVGYVHIKDGDTLMYSVPLTQRLADDIIYNADDSVKTDEAIFNEYALPEELVLIGQPVHDVIAHKVKIKEDMIAAGLY